MKAPMGNVDTWRDLDAVTVNVLNLIAAGHSMTSAAPLLRLTLSQATYGIRSGLDRWKLTSRTGLMHLACMRGAVSLDLHPQVKPRRQLDPLETLVLRHAAEDRSYPRIAKLVCRSEYTVKRKVKTILDAFHANHMAHAVYRAHQLDLLTPEAVDQALIPRPTWRPLPSTVVEVVYLVATGMTNHEIAEELGITRDNVKDRLKQAHVMWRNRNRAHLVHLAHQRGVLTRPADRGTRG